MATRGREAGNHSTRCSHVKTVIVQNTATSGWEGCVLLNAGLARQTRRRATVSFRMALRERASSCQYSAQCVATRTTHKTSGAMAWWW